MNWNQAFSSPYWLVLSLLSRFTCLSVRLWLHSWRVVLLLLGIYVASAAVLSEQAMFRIREETNQRPMYPSELIYKLNAVSWVFACDHNLRRVSTMLALTHSGIIPAEAVLAELEKAIMLDPYTQDLQAARAELVGHMRTGK